MHCFFAILPTEAAWEAALFLLISRISMRIRREIHDTLLDQAALRRYGSYSAKAENGSEGIVYHSVNGSIEIVAHPFVKEGESFLLPDPAKNVILCGASDVTFKRPGQAENIFRELVDNAGVELRSFSDLGLMIKLPAQCVKYTGITD